MVVLYDIDVSLIYIFQLTQEEFFNSREFISHSTYEISSCSLNWVNGVSRAKAMIHIMKDSCSLCLFKSSQISGLRRMPAKEYGQAQIQCFPMRVFCLNFAILESFFFQRIAVLLFFLSKTADVYLLYMLVIWYR